MIKQKDLFFFLAHGENWEITASRKVSDLVKKILEEQDHTKQSVEENGTFELHYTPSDAKRKSYKIPLSTGSKSPQPQQNDEQFVLKPLNSDLSRF